MIVQAPVATRVTSVQRTLGFRRTQASVSSDLHFFSECWTTSSRRASGDSPLTLKYLTLFAPFTLAVNLGKGIVVGSAVRSGRYGCRGNDDGRR